jgi:hypothetical protein
MRAAQHARVELTVEMTGRERKMTGTRYVEQEIRLKSNRLLYNKLDEDNEWCVFKIVPKRMPFNLNF